MQALTCLGHEGLSVAPIVPYVADVNAFLEGKADVVEGVAEKMPFDDQPFDVRTFYTKF